MVVSSDLVTVPQINAAIARLTFLTNGKIGRDWRSQRVYVSPDKGSEWDALIDALEALRAARSALSVLPVGDVQGSIPDGQQCNEHQPHALSQASDAHGDGYCGCTERCKSRENCQYDVKPEGLNGQDEVLLAYGILWCADTTDKRVHTARRELLKCLDKDLQAKAISAARTTLALVRDIRQMKGATFAADFEDATLSKTSSCDQDAGNLRSLSAPPPVSVQAVGQGWQPIETAPKDGTRIIAVGWGWGIVGNERHVVTVIWRQDREEWCESDDDEDDSACAYLTHWMPLPAPPDAGNLTGGAE